ncbi:MAG TPA: hypothetical protein VG244_10560 [Acidimicrobiales bacterium]|jgi:hypothetical protein|nr:hypothetical protein [Acidimicrobiales bacterium]
MSRAFPYELDVRFAPVWAPLLLAPGLQGVMLTDQGRMVARYGFLVLDTPLTNISDAHITGPYRWWRAVGPRLSFADAGLTFGTTNHGGVCVHFREPVRGVIGFRDHSALTVTVTDREGLVRAVTA